MNKSSQSKPSSTASSGKHSASPDPAQPARDPLSLNSLDKIVMGLIAAMLVVAPLLAGTFATPPPPSPASLLSALSQLEAWGIPLTHLLTGTAFLVMLYREKKRPVAIGPVAGLTGSAALLGLWAALSLTRAPALGIGLNALALLFTALLAGGIITRLGRDKNGFATLLLAVVVGGSLVALFGVREYLIRFREGVPYHRTFSTFLNPDFLAGYLLLTLPLTLAAFSATDRREARFGLGVGIALQSACMLLTGSRAGVAVMFGALLLWLALMLWSQSLLKNTKRVAAALGIFVLSGLLASTPTISRITGGGNSKGLAAAVEATAASQSHSGAFRTKTWSGTLNMAKANPLLGAGLGTYEITYARYATTAFTAHAHNAFLQTAGETGFPGLLLLLVTLAAAAAFALHVLWLQRRQEEEPVDSLSVKEENPLFDAPGILLSGLLTALFALLAHSFIDSNWYVAGTLMTLSAVVALMVAQGRAMAPLSTQRPVTLSPLFAAIGIAVSLFLLWRGGATGISRMQSLTGFQAMMQGQLPDAFSAYTSASAADPLDPEPLLQTALLSQAVQRPEEALKALQSAARVSQTGKVYFRLGQFYARREDWNNAIAAFEKVAITQPRNVQNLRALGDALRKASQKSVARSTYQIIADLENSPYGKIRAMPEMPETEFAYAHVGLAEMDAEEQRWAEAANQYALAVTVLKEFWHNRNELPVLAMARDKAEKYQELLNLYDRSLTQWQECLKAAGRSAEIAPIAEQQKTFQKERVEHTTLLQTPGGNTP